MLKVMFVFGTRPEAIKLCPLVIELKKHPEKYKVTVCVTAQHREMLDQVLQVFGVTPDIDLNIMLPNQTLYDVTSRCITEIGKAISSINPDICILQGDTTTTFAGSLACFYGKVRIVHIEAGLRTGKKYSPFPEEINRRLVSVMADLHCAPTEYARSNLLKEGVSGNSIFVTGNTVVDALLWVRDKLKNTKTSFDMFSQIDFSKRIILVTGHRRENFGSGFESVCLALKKIATSNQDVELIYPVHLNPNVRAPVNKILSGIDNIHLIEPLDYEPFVYIMDKCEIIVTDSGGVQEEAPSLGKPTLVTRNDTERQEAVQAGVVKLVGTDTQRIVEEVQRLLDDKNYYDSMSRPKNPYGDGDSCVQIARLIQNFFVTSGCKSETN